MQNGTVLPVYLSVTVAVLKTKVFVECIPKSTKSRKVKVGCCNWDAKLVENSRREGLHCRFCRVHLKIDHSEKS